MNKLEIVFIPLLASSHLTSSIEFAKRLVDQDERLHITFFIILLPNQTDLDPNTKSFAHSHSRIRCKIIPPPTTPNPHLAQVSSSPISIEMFATLFIESHKHQVEKEVIELVSRDDSTKVIGFVVDMFCTSMIDVANKFKVPSYVLFTSNTSFLGFLLHMPVRHKKVGIEFHPSDRDSVIPSYKNPLPANVIPQAAMDKTGRGYEAFLYCGTKFQESKGFIVNSFVELEPYAVGTILAQQPVYPVGPLLDHSSRNKSTGSIDIINWLDAQPPKSVLFLCFGSMGSFNELQLQQIAIALEKSGHRFLWSIRKQPEKGAHGPTTDYTNVENVLPAGFLERVKDRGMICGWAPQVEVLAHGAVNGFVSHCGWNSVLESVWYGVPIATWPLNAEQQINAFLMVKELGLGVELSLSYRSSGSQLVNADEIEKAINSLMDDKNPVREKVKDISEKSRKAVINGGSSFDSLGKLVRDMLQNTQ